MTGWLCGNCLKSKVQRQADDKHAYYVCEGCFEGRKVRLDREVVLHSKYQTQPFQVESILLGPRPKRENNFVDENRSNKRRGVGSLGGKGRTLKGKGRIQGEAV
jgi:hypothetical protein